ncbi:hypothetical protein INT08_03760 [Prosthecochloris sp. N3]|uniref:Uncharacterized protein n=1 Tax=Prosthecochloris ethylica TaxID=2743976 RepID=A0ABR9XR66_9CHLB|nr:MULTISPECIES: hypothetical protein [Prosthecochloris]MEC9486766.1 hypothetical protein [Prosthecochloris sp.]MBF0585510.1 hypothetical protein [Prosthecochloris ethylica]MBF0636296.1 hypothetical protein [Prosthecochloris ethylica]NUK46740.1 hypothetical protein [Prosthecochloris ethylica]RNA64677.1 hypothetical protein CR163_005130 [Prosthecochloris sp. ZM_2]
MGVSFSNVPQDSSMTVIFEQEIEIQGRKVLYRKWHGEGTTGDDFWFARESAADLDDAGITGLVHSSPLADARAEVTVFSEGNFVCARTNVHAV